MSATYYCYKCEKKISSKHLMCAYCGRRSHTRDKCAKITSNQRKRASLTEWFCRPECMDAYLRLMPFYSSQQYQASHTNQLHIGFIEIGNLSKYRYAVWKMITLEQYDILLLMNTNVDDKYDVKRLKYPGYHFIQNLSRTIGIYCRKELHPRKMNYVDKLNMNFHLLIVSLGARYSGLTLALVRRPPQADDHAWFMERLTG